MGVAAARSQGGRISFNAAAGQLNKRGIQSITGGIWSGEQLQRMAIRLGLHHPLAFVRADVARATIVAVCATQKALTGKQIAALAGTEHSLGIKRTREIVKDLRKSAARRSAVHRRMGWPLDKFTDARIWAAAIWARHPEFSANEVHAMLQPGHGVGARWVGRILRYCWRSTKPRGSKAWRLGRRCYGWHYSARRNRRAPCEGALSAGFASAAQPLIIKFQSLGEWGTVLEAVQAGLIGGEASKLAGGKFENGLVLQLFST